MTPPTVLVERTFLDALAAPHHDRGDEVRARYLELVAAYERRELRLRARHDHLAEHHVDIRRRLFAPIEAIHVATQFRRQATRLEVPAEMAGHVDHDLAVTLVVIRRERIGRVASLLPVFDLLHLPAPA
jgi:hypothetical protein